MKSATIRFVILIAIFGLSFVTAHAHPGRQIQMDAIIAEQTVTHGVRCGMHGIAMEDTALPHHHIARKKQPWCLNPQRLLVLH